MDEATASADKAVEIAVRSGRKDVAFKFLLLPAFTTGSSKKVARRHNMDNGK